MREGWGNGSGGGGQEVWKMLECRDTGMGWALGLLTRHRDFSPRPVTNVPQILTCTVSLSVFSSLPLLTQGWDPRLCTLGNHSSSSPCSFFQTSPIGKSPGSVTLLQNSVLGHRAELSQTPLTTRRKGTVRLVHSMPGYIQ